MSGRLRAGRKGKHPETRKQEQPLRGVETITKTGETDQGLTKGQFVQTNHKGFAVPDKLSGQLVERGK